MSTSAVVDALRERLTDRVSTAKAVREHHCQTLTWLPRQPPEAVVAVEDADEVSWVVALCDTHGVPVIPFGVGSSLEGQLNAPRGGISLDLSKMDKVVRVSADDMTATVQPGVTREQLNRRLRDSGLFFPVDPGANASLGGMASTRASGTNAVRYGTMRDNVRELEVVLPDGRIIRAGSLARKSSAGYDLANLFVGAEGTLGVITELTVRLHQVPERIGSGVCAFPSVNSACQAVINAIALGIGLARIELLDVASVRACNEYSGLGLDEQVHLFVELHASDAALPDQAGLLADVFAEHDGGGFEWSTDLAVRNKLWQARHDAWWAIHARYPGRKGIPTDVCVPVSRLAECVTATQQDIRASGLDAPIIGHVGDGNFHLLVMIDESDASMVTRAKDLVHRLTERAIQMGGTCTGEHGIGQGKADAMRLEHGSAVDVMRAIKQALDPRDIMNPGKIIPAWSG
jgi:D-lactate dehydrogenase (cytochrome)